jgi:hypothetical protein
VLGSVRKQAGADHLQREFGNAFVPLLISDVVVGHWPKICSPAHRIVERSLQTTVTVWQVARAGCFYIGVGVISFSVR